mgnify:CR=1 FL=1
MPVFWYLKTISSVTWSSVPSFRKFILFGGFLAFVSTFLYLPCLNLTGNLYLKLTACVNNQAWNYRRCQENNNKMAPTIGGICEDRHKDRDDIVVKERAKLSSTNKRGKINFYENCVTVTKTLV